MLARMQPTIAHISIHALREEGDVLTSIKDNHPRIFLSTPSARRATEWGLTFDAINEFLSTPSARRVTGIFPPAHSLSGNF